MTKEEHKICEESWKKVLASELLRESGMEIKYDAILNIFAPHSLGINFLDRLIELKIINADTYERNKIRNGKKIYPATECSTLLKYLWDESRFII